MVISRPHRRPRARPSQPRPLASPDIAGLDSRLAGSIVRDPIRRNQASSSLPGVRIEIVPAIPIRLHTRRVLQRPSLGLERLRPLLPLRINPNPQRPLPPPPPPVIPLPLQEGFGAYAASKAAVRSFARTWSAELKSRGIRVNVVSPAWIETPGGTAAFGDEETALAMKAHVAATVPKGRMGRPDEVAAVVTFLASEQSSYVVGANFYVDGGENQT